MTKSRSLDRRLTLALVANAVVVATQTAVGLAASSLGLLADAGHNLTDVAALGLALWAVKASRREPSARRSFGWHRGGALAAQANAAGLLIVTAVLAAEAIRRLSEPPPVRGGLVAAMAAFAAIVNAGSAFLLARHTGDLGTRSAFVHLAGDAAVSIAVACAGLAIFVTDGNYWLDPVATLAVAGVLLVAAWKLLRQSADVLLEATPAGVNPADVIATIVGVPGVESVHDLHVWSLSSSVHALSAHVIVAGHPSLEEAQRVGTAVKAAVSAPYRIAHATVELECEGCVDDGAWCAVSPAVLAREGLPLTLPDPHGH